MPNSDNQEVARLERVNAELVKSLQQCRDVLNEWRSRMTANNNDASPSDSPQHDDRRA